jgi:hypothetical protein
VEEEVLVSNSTVGAAPVLCRCGHSRFAHQHYRSGIECALGDQGHCDHFVREPAWWRRLISSGT